MIRTVFNIVSGRTGKWNRLREPKLREVEEIVNESYLHEYKTQYLPFVYGAVQLVDDFISPHKTDKSIKCNPKSITDDMYSELIDAATASLIQIYLNVTQDDEETEEAIKELYMDCILQPDDEFEDLEINEFEDFDDPNLQGISSHMLSEFRKIVKAKPADFLENLIGFAYVGPTFQMVQELRLSRSAESLLKH